MDPMNDERADVMSERVHLFHKNVGTIHTRAGSVWKSESSSAKSYVSLSEGFLRMARNENNKNLRHGMKSVGDCLSDIETERESFVLGRVHSSLVQKLKDMDTQCNIPTLAMLKDRNASIKSSIRFKEQFESLASKSTSQRRVEKKRTQLQAEEKRVYAIDRTLQQNLLRYEKQRVQDCKQTFEDFVKGQLLFHCRAIESLSATLKAIAVIDPADGVDQLCEDLHISAKDKQLLDAASVVSAGPP